MNDERHTVGRAAQQLTVRNQQALRLIGAPDIEVIAVHAGDIPQ